jgi:hypothetical protein
MKFSMLGHSVGASRIAKKLNWQRRTRTFSGLRHFPSRLREMRFPFMILLAVTYLDGGVRGVHSRLWDLDTVKRTVPGQGECILVVYLAGQRR